ncbi:MAG: integration host factor subunit beta [Planctomycetes bacterium]|nr:integration host factor subunit beta [Planctomycetota bacterium]
MTTKREIVKSVAELSALTQAQTHEVVQLTLDAIADTVVREGRLELRRFGVFEVKHRKARKARDPRDGKTLDVPARDVLVFRPCKELEQRVAEAGGS